MTLRLTDPFEASEVSWRVGSTTKDKDKGMALAFINARNVMDRLDDVFGPMGWGSDYEFHGSRIICTIRTWDGDTKQWVAKSDGAGDTDIESEKGGLSDAFKRAGVKWGIGRYLYTMTSPWVKIEGQGKSWRIARSELGKLDAIAEAALGKSLAVEAGRQTPKANGNPKPEGGAVQSSGNSEVNYSVSEKRVAEGLKGSELPSADTPPGVQLLELMRQRCAELEIDAGQAGAHLNEIILVDLALNKTPEVFVDHWAQICNHIHQWTQGDG